MFLSAADLLDMHVHYILICPCCLVFILILLSLLSVHLPEQILKILLGVITNWALALTQLLFVCIYFPNSLSVSDYGKCMHIKHAIEGIHKTERVTHFKIHYLFQFVLFQAHYIIYCLLYVSCNIREKQHTAIQNTESNTERLLPSHKFVK